MRDQGIKEFGSTDCPGAKEWADHVYGIPLRNCLPLQFLLGVDVIPLERSFSVVGDWGSCKSAFSWFLSSLFLRAGGMVTFIDTEHKTNPDQVQGIIQNPELFEMGVMPAPAYSMEDMMEKMTFWAQQYRKAVPTLDIPMLIFVDSLGAVTSKEAIEKVETQGSTDSKDMGAARRAANLTEFMKAYAPKYLKNAPISLCFVNHQKTAIEIGQAGKRNFGPKTTEPGGVHKDFGATYTLELKKGKNESGLVNDVQAFSIKTKKSAFSQTGKRIYVKMITRQADDEDKLIVDFDWDTSLAELLVSDKISKDALKKVVTVTKVTNTKFNCTKLGLKEVHPSELGRALHENEEIYRGLQRVLKVIPKRTFQGPAAASGTAVPESEGDGGEGSEQKT
jgi:hypothetical protein